ncbi:hypothetical protein AB9F41_10470 [Rhizobium leguminosarum]|uniref:hypothetical protein n=1 Tax=Rhizobium leguminosarum TaxID=384 RepID=UPI003F9750F3
MASLIYRRAFTDTHGLAQLCHGIVPSMAETQRRIFLSERRTDFGLPDHFYKGYLEDRLSDVESVAELPLHVLRRLSARYLERRDGRVMVRLDRFAEWHHLLPFISPLAVVVCFLVENGARTEPTDDPRDFLQRELGDTAIIGAHDLALDDLIERKGLHEMHMHLNGSTELDILWSDASRNPDALHIQLNNAAGKNPKAVAELYEQLEYGLTPYIFYQRMRALRRVRHYIAEAIEPSRRRPIQRVETSDLPNQTDLLAAMSADMKDRDWAYVNRRALSDHPANVRFGRRRYSRLINEAAWLYLCLSYLRARPGDPVVGLGLYFNFLLLNQMTRLAVQQMEEAGFDQFQKYTLLGTREDIERHYEGRFRQLNLRPPHTLLSHLEGRFAPKNSGVATHSLVMKIVGDFLAFRGCGHRRDLHKMYSQIPPCLLSRPCDRTECSRRGRHDLEFSLVAHFIKKPANHRHDDIKGILHSNLRADVDVQSRQLRELVSHNPVIKALLKGVDAASNELHTPPEPFAPAFRTMRYAGVDRATFHVGEDFRHLVSGIRAVVEAMRYLDLRPGDRIGHATALGIDPDLWLDRAAPRMIINCHDALDDAVFAQQELSRLGGFEGDVMRLENFIVRTTYDLYDEEIHPVILTQAWELRDLDIAEISRVEAQLRRQGRVANAGNVAEEARMLAQETIDQIRSRELAIIADRLEATPAAYATFRRRHQLGSRGRLVVEVARDFLSSQALCALQEFVLADVNRRGVALETLPTSNTRISVYKDMTEHHIFRWLGLTEPKLVNKPTVVVGSDDPGIFCTNIKNEYAVLLTILRTKFGKSNPESVAILESVNDSGRIHRFRPGSP